MAVNKNDIEDLLVSNEHLINMEESLSKIKDDTNHIASIEYSDSQHIESLDNSSLGIYQILQDMLLDSHNISSHFDNNNSNVSNPSGTTSPIGNRMSVVDDILREIKAFRTETKTALDILVTNGRTENTNEEDNSSDEERQARENTRREQHKKDKKRLIVRLFDEDPRRISDSLYTKFFLDEIITGTQITANAMDADSIIFAVPTSIPKATYEKLAAVQNKQIEDRKLPFWIGRSKDEK